MKKKASSSLKSRFVLVPVAALMMASALPGVASAWTRWTGIDPVIDLNGTAAGGQLNIYIEWPAEFTCAIEGPIDVSVRLPGQYKNAVLVDESDDSFACGTGTNIITTETDLSSQGNGKGNVVKIEADVDADTEVNFPVKVRVSLDGDEIAVLEGTHHKGVKGNVKLG